MLKAAARWLMLPAALAASCAFMMPVATPPAVRRLLRRCLQRWCVEACTENHWEIPFTQLTLHQAESMS